MVIQYRNIDKFRNSELRIGLSLDKQEISGSNYKRIYLMSHHFEKRGDYFENIVPFGFAESFSHWGNVNSCLCFYNDEIVGWGDADKPRYVSARTTVMFDVGKFKIWFD